MSVDSNPHTLAIFHPASRSRAATRAILWSAGACLCGVVAFQIYTRLHFGPTLAGSRLVNISIAVIALPLPILTVALGIRAARWILLAAWPKRVGIRATAADLALELGPFGRARYDTARLDVRYPFELSGDETEGGFEAFLPEEEQLARFIPRMVHPAAREPIHRTVLRFAHGDEAEIAAVLRPAFDAWRKPG